MNETNNLSTEEGRTLSSMGTMSSFLDIPIEDDMSPEDSKLSDTPKPLEGDVDVKGLSEDKGSNLEDDSDVTPSNSEDGGELKDDNNIDSVDNKSSEDGVSENTPNGLDYRDVFNDLVSLGLYEEPESIVMDSGEVIPFKDFKMDAEGFASMIKTKFDEIEKAASENKVSLDGVSDFTQKLISIEKNGGDINQALQVYKDYVNPLEKFDLTTEAGQIDMLRLRYLAEGKLQPDEIDAIIYSFKNSGVLEEKSLLAKEQMEGAVNNQLHNIELEGQKRIKEEQERIKAYRNSLSESLTSQFSLNESTKRRFLDAVTKYVVDESDGTQKLPIDVLYENALLDPNKASRLLMFLINEEEYNKQISEEAVRKTNLKTMRLTGVISKNKTSNTKLNNGYFEDRGSGEIDVERL